MDDIIRTSNLLTRDMNFNHLVSVLVEQSLDVTRSDMAAYFSYSEEPEKKTTLTRIYKRGRWDVAETLDRKSSLVEFIEESEETVIVLMKKKDRHFPSIILNETMESAIALPIFTPDFKLGILILNSVHNNYYNHNRFQFLNSLSKLASGMLNNARLFNEMKESYKKIEGLERYQKSIFSSMTDLLITLDSAGNFYYANNEAIAGFNLNENYPGISCTDFFEKKLSKSVLNSIEECHTSSHEFLGLKGMYKDKELDKEIDFQLNISPLMGTRGKKLGTVLIFNDETKTRNLQKKMNIVTEERRQIKDMFSRYLSKDLVNSLINQPELVKLGGAQKQATVLFADIRGYTSFSEGKEPAYIIEILNEYFDEAVEKVISSHGFIDKFIGDCIMAAWGVPMVSEQEDAINAVTCALEIQKLINSKKRHFFKGYAENLKVGIGLHSGFLVAGNLGSSRRMDYTIIGDTVNIAARLEGVAEAGEVIITQSTKEKLSDLFRLEKRTPVKVKGKSKPIHIYNVLERIK
ncbi:MAG: guanylate cyclase [Spirochaetaceae bacterium]|nr:guanylate cyclase [Spirochaetaceae bacterium]